MSLFPEATARGEKRKLSGSDNEGNSNSPESLVPVRDPYPSDEERQMILQRQKSPNMATGKEPKMVLTKIFDSTSMKAEYVLFFLNVDFVPMIKEVNLENATVEDCLYHLFQFVSNTKANRDQFKYLNKTMEELHKFYCTESPLGWLTENDNINYKKVLPEDTAKKEKYFIQMAKPGKTDNNCVFYAHSVLKLYKKFCECDAVIEATIKENKKYLQLKSSIVKEFLDFLPWVVQPQYFKRSGSMQTEFPLKIRSSDISGGSFLVEDTNVKIITKPDGVFLIDDHNEIPKGSMFECNEDASNISKIVIEVYDPSDNSDVAHEISWTAMRLVSPSTALLSPAKHSRDIVSPIFPKPEKTKDSIVDNNYKSAGRKYIKQSLPQQCLDHLCMDKIAGQHVMQLFAQAFMNRSSNLKNETNLESVGMFLMNEYVYFSKLHVKSKVLDILNYGSNRLNTENLFLEARNESYFEENPPRVCYSNFCLDITIPNHRHALAMFLREYLFKQMLETESH